MSKLTYDEIVKILQLEKLPVEGGMFKKVNMSDEIVSSNTFRKNEFLLYGNIYFLLKQGVVSRMHKLKSDEIFHYYGGGSGEMLQIFPDGTHELVKIGMDLAQGQRPMVKVSRGVWQGTLCTKGDFLLLGTTMSPAYDLEDFEDGDFDTLFSLVKDKSIKKILETLTKEATY